MPAPDRSHTDYSIATTWVRTALRQCAALDATKSLLPGTKPMLVFAIRWAPFGGATAEELFVNFGVTRQQFLRMTGAALAARRSDDPRTSQLKQHLLMLLTQAWRPDRDTESTPVIARPNAS
ncbi:hypothetical protein NLM24_30940 [Nocardia zapadnayensis]|uniref:hypothetical protein n=1 Tax=Nocardia rhamnosiphila TaxID=426716 RepID=UPI002246213A|nr:hypothetical protein [Nocardia zapadnayensis]MCX0275034.1 hypothetical protein [Nocardia zapadnayensis]